MSHHSLPQIHSSFVLASAPPLAGRAASAPGAQTQAPGAQSDPAALPGGPAPASPFGGSSMLLVMFAVLALMLVMSAFTGNKEKKKRAAMLASIGRNDRVQTIGGVIGTVVEMRDDEMVLRVDDSNNTRITFSRSSVQGVLKKRSDSSAEAPQPGALAAR